MKLILGTLFCMILVMGCKHTETECYSLSCFKAQAQKDHVRACIKGFQRAAMKRPYKTVLPYDDPQWQHDYCRAKARRIFK